MPIIKSAQKKVRQDKKRTAGNKKYASLTKTAIKKLKKGKAATAKDFLKKAYSSIDKSVKRKVMHKKKARHLKSKLSQLAAKKKSPK